MTKLEELFVGAILLSTMLGVFAFLAHLNNIP